MTRGEKSHLEPALAIREQAEVKDAGSLALEQGKVGSWAKDPEGTMWWKPYCDSFNKVN